MFAALRGARRVVGARVYTTEALSESLYSEKCHRTFSQLLDQFDSVMDALLDKKVENVDIIHSNDVLSLDMGAHGIYVINKQVPTRQIWLSSPIGGPRRFDYSPEKKTWVSSKDGKTLDGLLTDELRTCVSPEIEIKIRVD